MLQGQWVWLRDTSHWTEGTPDTQILSSWTDVSMNWGLQGGGLPGGTDGQKKQLEFGERGWADREPGNARPEPVIWCGGLNTRKAEDALLHQPGVQS